MQVPRRAAHFLARHRRAAWNRAVAKACRAYLNAFDNLDYDGFSNGEFALIQRTSCPPSTAVLDVGANVGSWASTFHTRHPGAPVHAFEIDPVVAEQLARRFSGDPEITVVSVGLSDHPGHAAVHRSSRSGRTTSVVSSSATEPDVTAPTFEVDLRDGDGYLAEAGIDHVRFMKVDTEGNDLNVVKGFVGALAAGRIDALQFEHNEWSVPAGVHLKDFYDLLDPLGYDIGRLYPDCVLFRPWRPAYEREAAGNHVAVRREQAVLRAELAGAAR